MSELAEKIIQQYKELPIVKRAFTRLRNELPEHLHYHSVNHTEDVFSEAIRFAVKDKLPAKDLDLLAVACVFHDFGFLVRYSENEIYGAEFAALAMEESGLYSPADIELVAQMIMDTGVADTETGLRAVATTTLSGYLIDADLSNLGRTDFLEKTKLIAQERKQPIEQVYPTVLALMLAHNWYTPAAASCREDQKQLNIKFVKEQITCINKS